jgi:hypothetical protein
MQDRQWSKRKSPLSITGRNLPPTREQDTVRFNNNIFEADRSSTTGNRGFPHCVALGLNAAPPIDLPFFNSMSNTNTNNTTNLYGLAYQTLQTALFKQKRYAEMRLATYLACRMNVPLERGKTEYYDEEGEKHKVAAKTVFRRQHKNNEVAGLWEFNAPDISKQTGIERHKVYAFCSQLQELGIFIKRSVVNNVQYYNFYIELLKAYLQGNQSLADMCRLVDEMPACNRNSDKLQGGSSDATLDPQAGSSDTSKVVVHVPHISNSEKEEEREKEEVLCSQTRKGLFYSHSPDPKADSNQVANQVNLTDTKIGSAKLAPVKSSSLTLDLKQFKTFDDLAAHFDTADTSQKASSSPKASNGAFRSSPIDYEVVMERVKTRRFNKAMGLN